MSELRPRGSRKQARGYTLNTAHLSEYAYYDDAETYLGSIIASCEGRIIVESTPNHHDDPLHKIVTSNSPEWHVVFLPWYSFPEYAEPVPAEFQRTEEEDELANAFNLTDAQLYWRRKKMSSYNDPWLFKRDFPITIEEAWTLGDDNFFTENQLSNIIRTDIGPTYAEIAQPIRGAQYVIGVDPAGGVGGDDSAAYVLDRTTHLPAAVFCSNRLTIRDYVTKLVGMARKYNDAFIHFELNNHGHAVKEILDSLGYVRYATFTTSAQSKIKLFDNLRDAISSGTAVGADQHLLSQLRQLQRDKNGLAPKHPPGGHDDRVIAFALALEGFKYVAAPLSTTHIPRPKQQTGNQILSKTNLLR